MVPGIIKRDTNGVLTVAPAWNPTGSILPPQPDGNRARAKPLEKTIILIVEDEAIIRLATAALLEDAGYGVLEACDADVAVKLLESRSDIRAVFTDIVMPGSLDGLKLARAIRDRWPPVHLLVTSGRNAPTEWEIPRKARFLRKPYAPKHVLKALDELFGPSPGPYSYVPNLIQNYGKVA
jgi:CheY-like chemotaxis protein